MRLSGSWTLPVAKVRTALSFLRQCLSSKQAEVAELRMQIHTLGQTELPGLLRDTSVLQVTRVLHGDYDLKLARQDYFISKQDKVGRSLWIL